MKSIIKNNIKFNFIYQDVNHTNTKLVTHLCNLIIKNINNFRTTKEIEEINIKISPIENDVIFTTPTKNNETTLICDCEFNYQRSKTHRVRLYTLDLHGEFYRELIRPNEEYY